MIWLQGIEHFPVGTSGKELTWKCRRHNRHGFDHWVGEISWRRAWQPLQYSCWEKPMGRGAWWTTVHGVTQSCTQLKWLSTHTQEYRVLAGRRAQNSHVLINAIWPVAFFSIVELVLTESIIPIESWSKEVFNQRAIKIYGVILLTSQA